MSISLVKGVHLVHVQQQYILTRPGLDLARLEDLTIRPQRMSRQKMHSNHDEEIRRQHYSQATQGLTQQHILSRKHLSWTCISLCML